MTRWTSDRKSRASKKAKAVRRELEGGKPADHLKPIPRYSGKLPKGTKVLWRSTQTCRLEGGREVWSEEYEESIPKKQPWYVGN